MTGKGLGAVGVIETQLFQGRFGNRRGQGFEVVATADGLEIAFAFGVATKLQRTGPGMEGGYQHIARSVAVFFRHGDEGLQSPSGIVEAFLAQTEAQLGILALWRVGMIAQKSLVELLRAGVALVLAEGIRSRQRRHQFAGALALKQDPADFGQGPAAHDVRAVGVRALQRSQIEEGESHLPAFNTRCGGIGDGGRQRAIKMLDLEVQRHAARHLAYFTRSHRAIFTP